MPDTNSGTLRKITDLHAGQTTGRASFPHRLHGALKKVLDSYEPASPEAVSQADILSILKYEISSNLVFNESPCPVMMKINSIQFCCK